MSWISGIFYPPIAPRACEVELKPATEEDIKTPQPWFHYLDKIINSTAAPYFVASELFLI